MIALDQRRRLIASARMLESDRAGERQAALEAMLRLLPTGFTLADLLDRALPVAQSVALRPAPLPVRPEPAAVLRRWQRKARTVAAFPALLSERDLLFVAQVALRSTPPTPKQNDWLNDLAARVEARVS